MRGADKLSASAIFAHGLRVALATAMVSLAWPSPSVGWSAPVARQSRILRLSLDHAVSPPLTDLETPAASAGMHCRTVIYAVHGRHSPPPTRGLQCALPEDTGFFEAFVSPHSAQVLIKIYETSESAPRGEIEPAIDRVLLAYKQVLIDSHNLKTVMECLMPDIEPCLKDSM